MKLKQKGFTMIELVIVIAILGILAAIALPRYANLQQQANISSANAIASSLRIGVALAKTKYETNLALGNTERFVDFDDNPATTNDIVSMNVPVKRVAQPNSEATCQSIVNALLQNSSDLIVTYRPFFACNIRSRTSSGYTIIFRPSGVDGSLQPVTEITYP